MPRPHVLAPALGALLALFFEPFTLRAATEGEAPPRALLELDAGAVGERCLTKSELEQAVQAQLGRVAFVAEGAPATLVVRVRLEESAPGHFRATVTSEPVPPTADTPTSARALEASGDCRALDEPLALVVALLVDAEPTPPEPVAVETAPAPEPEPPAPPVQDTSPVSSAPTWESAPSGPWQLGVGAAGVVGFGALPHVAAGAAVEVLVTPPSWPGLRVRAMGFAPDRARAAPGAWLDVTLLLAGAGVCPELGVVGPLRIAACLRKAPASGHSCDVKERSEDASPPPDTVLGSTQVEELDARRAGPSLRATASTSAGIRSTTTATAARTRTTAPCASPPRSVTTASTTTAIAWSTTAAGRSAATASTTTGTAPSTRPTPLAP